MIINHNVPALNTYRQLNTNTQNTSKSIEKLSSGLRINRAGDDAAGLAISEKMRGQIRGLDMASKNAQDGISMIQTAEGALNETHSILQRMKELATQAANGTNTVTDRGEIQKEINQLTSEVNRIGNTTEFNTKKLLNGDMSDVKAMGSTSTTTIDDIAAADLKYAAGVSITGSTGFKFMNGTTENQIKIADDDGEVFEYTSADAGTLSIKKNSDGGLTIKLDGGSDGTDTLDFEDKNAILKDGVYSYDNHGITFSISEADVKAMATGDGIEIDFAAREGFTTPVPNKGNIDLASDYTGTSVLDANVNVIDDFEVDASKLNPNAAKIELAVNAGTLTLTIKDAKDQVLNTTEAATSVVGAFEEYGVKFSLNASYDDTNDNFELKPILLKSTTTTTVNATKDASEILQIGANEKQSMNLAISDMRAGALGITGSGSGYSTANNVTDGTNNSSVEKALDVTSNAGAGNAITIFDKAIATVSGERAKLGAVQNRLEHTINNLNTSSENLTSAESRIRDTDMAKTMMDQTKNNILAQAAQAMLAQANQQPQGVLQLLRG